MTPLRKRFAMLLPVLAFLALPWPAVAESEIATGRHLTYDLQGLDVPAEMGSSTTASGINNLGTVVGNYVSTDGSVHGFLLLRGRYIDSTVPGAGPTVRGSLGDINDWGVAVGAYTDGNDVGHIYLRGPLGKVTRLPDPTPDALDTDASGINNFGIIVGTYVDAAGATHGFVWRSGHYETIDYPGAIRTRLIGLNDRGQMVGFWSDADGHSHGFVLDDGDASPIEFPDAVSTRATGINNRGTITGFYNNEDGVFHGFVYDDGKFTAVDFPGASDTVALGINDQGAFVGTYNDFNRGFLAVPRRH